MSDQYGVYAPPPEIPGMTPEEPQPAAEPPAPKRKTGLIIAVVLGLLLVSCACLAAGGLLLFSTSTSSSVPTISETPVTIDPQDPAEADRLAEWIAWNPSVVEQLPAAPAEDEPLIKDAVNVMAPDFVALDTGYAEGFVDEGADYYYGDLYLVRAKHPSTDRVSAALEFTLQSPAMIAEDVPFEIEEGDVVDLIADGTIEMIHRGRFGNADFPIESSEGAALWTRIGQDWPDGVVMRITTETADQVSVSITKWRQYAIDDYSPRLYAIYSLDAGQWDLSDWEYESFEDVPQEPVDEVPIT